jgi:aspartate carbamoyltransferase catalytic subunit
MNGTQLLWTDAPHVFSAKQFSPEFLLDILFPLTRIISGMMQSDEGRRELSTWLRGRVLCTMFYEPSTRTRLSFELAALHLGMKVVSTENAAEFSSTKKGEVFRHTIEVISRYFPDVIVLRHKVEGTAAQAARISRVPIINGGDGPGQHPTQALLDLFCIFEKLGRIEGLTVALCGDLRYGRTIRSLAYLLSKFPDVKLILASPPELRLNDDLKAHLDERKVAWREVTNLQAALRDADVVYFTRTQAERLRWRERLRLRLRHLLGNNHFKIGLREVEQMQPNSILMHPLPIAGEVAHEVDYYPKAVYFDQAGYGMAIRMALLRLMLVGGAITPCERV